MQEIHAVMIHVTARSHCAMSVPNLLELNGYWNMTVSAVNLICEASVFLVVTWDILYT